MTAMTAGTAATRATEPTELAAPAETTEPTEPAAKIEPRPADATMATVARGLRIFAIACVILLVFNSASLRSAVRDLPADRVTDWLVLGADTWHGWMEAIGAADVAVLLRRPFEALHELTWPS